MEELSHKGKRWTQKEIDKMFDLRNNGCSYKEIGRQLGRTPNSVRRLYCELRKMSKAETMTRQRLIPIDGERLNRQMAFAGITEIELADVCGVEPTTVRYWIESNLMPRIAIAGIKNVYGIKYEDIEIEAEALPEKQTRDPLQVQEVRVSRETLVLFRNMMFAAVYEGVKKALNEKEGKDV